jgi:hypothetical protein
VENDLHTAARLAGWSKLFRHRREEHAMETDLTIQSAKLPDSYIEARDALAKCAHIDECQQWADKAAALASYAKQAKDRAMLILARRIQDRAVARGGELLQQVKAAKGGDRRSKNSLVPIGRKAAAEQAGITSGQAKMMLRVASLPKETRDALIEGPNPPPPSVLAEMGTKKREKPALTDVERVKYCQRQIDNILLKFQKDLNAWLDSKPVLLGDATSVLVQTFLLWGEQFVDWADRVNIEVRRFDLVVAQKSNSNDEIGSRHRGGNQCAPLQSAEG